MTRIENENSIIEIALDDTYENDKDFKSRYDIVINPQNRSQNENSKAYGIRVILQGQEHSIALIGDHNCWDDNCAVIEDDILTILQGWEITQINIITGQVTRSVVLDTMAPNFEIHRVNSGYLIYGETNITMLNDDLEALWSFSGYDIFVSGSDKTPFEIKGDRICLYDFFDHYYELDFQGNVLFAEQHMKEMGIE